MALHSVDGDHLREPVWIAIRMILMEDWDPVGVRDEAFAADEYESYIPKIKALLRSRATVEVLIDYLDWIEHERMGFTSKRERGRPAAIKLVQLASQLPPLS